MHSSINFFILLLILSIYSGVLSQNIPTIFVHGSRFEEDKKVASNLMQKEIPTILSTKTYSFVTNLEKIKTILKILEYKNFWNSRFTKEIPLEVYPMLQKEKISYLIVFEIKRSTKDKKEIQFNFKIFHINSQKNEIFQTQNTNWGKIINDWSTFFKNSQFFKLLENKSSAKTPEITKNLEQKEPIKLMNIGWFGETMPEGIKKSGIFGEYISAFDKSIMLYIPKGTFYRIQHIIPNTYLKLELAELEAFYIDKYEVSNEKFVNFLNAKSLKNIQDIIKLDGSSILQKEGKFAVKAGAENYPVVQVSWHGANEYLAWAKKSLPSEKHWEKCYCGGFSTPDWQNKETPIKFKQNPKSQQTNPLSKTQKFLFHTANLSGDADGYLSLAPIDAFDNLDESPYKVSQLIGNVWEWSESNSVEFSHLKIANGGSWGSNSEKIITHIALEPNTCSNDLGFRGIIYNLQK